MQVYIVVYLSVFLRVPSVNQRAWKCINMEQSDQFPIQIRFEFLQFCNPSTSNRAIHLKLFYSDIAQLAL